jgi:aldehyde dehydrogenase (NAD+)
VTDYSALVWSQKSRVASGVTASLEARRATLRKLLGALGNWETALLAALHGDLGKSASEAYVSEINVVRGECLHAIRQLPHWLKRDARRVPFLAWPGRSEVAREPCGTVLVIAPWNYPVHLALTPLAGALAAGNSVVLKPSERAPAVAKVIDEMISSTFDSSEIAVLRGGKEVGEQLLKQSFDHVFFTGSRATGTKVAEACASSLIPATLELGGKCPVIVFGGEERYRVALESGIELAARRIAWGKYLNAGQTCVAPDYVLVERKLYQPLVAALEKAFRSFQAADYGKMVDRAHFDRVRPLLDEGTIVYGGEADETTLHISPTLMTDLNVGAALMTHEIFGPILPVIVIDSLEEAIDLVGNNPDPLAIYPFTKDPRVIGRLRSELRSGAVCVNDVVVQVAGEELPFGGTGASGMGRYRGASSFALFTRERVIFTRGLRWEIPSRFPPLPPLKFLRKILAFLPR